jgi:oxalate decarboxylase
MFSRRDVLFRTPKFQEMSLSEWLKRSPAEMVADHLNVDPAKVANWPGNAKIMPE